jgi:hypothetical protein
MRLASIKWLAMVGVSGLFGLGCGSTSPPAPASSQAVAGLASSDSAVATVSMKDSSSPAVLRTTSPDTTGKFSLDARDMAPPFYLKAQTESRAEYAVAFAPGTTNVNPVTTAVLAGASRNEDAEDGEDGWSGKDSHVSENALEIMQKLHEVLKPLFDLYGIHNIGEDSEDGNGSNVRALLRDVSFTVKKGVVTVTNKATGGIIFTGSLRHLSEGTFYPANMPAGPGGGTTCASFTYSAFGACQSNNTQTRTVLTSSPTGCTGGSPVLTQACVFVPPPNTCTSFTYSAFGACQSNNTQTRTVLIASPTGCTGGTPVLTQACVFVPPPVTCTSFTYSAFGACQSDNTQTRTVLTSSPTGCTGGTPVLTQACVFVPPPVTCTSFTYSAFGACQSNNTQTRTVLTSSPTGCTGGTPVLTQACIFTPACTLATAVPSCSACHGLPPASHTGRPNTCATCHGPVNNGSGTPSTGMAAALSGTVCRLTYPTSGTHDNGVVNFGAAQ